MKKVKADARAKKNPRIVFFFPNLVPPPVRGLGKKVCRFTTGNADHIAAIDEEMFALLSESGLRQIFIGAESGSDMTFETLNKKAIVGDILF